VSTGVAGCFAVFAACGPEHKVVFRLGVYRVRFDPCQMVYILVDFSEVSLSSVDLLWVL